MTYATRAPFVLHLPRRRKAPRNWRLNLIAAVIAALLGLGLLLAPLPPETTIDEPALSSGGD